MGMKASNKIATFFKYFVLILVGVIMIYPLLWMISATLRTTARSLQASACGSSTPLWMATAAL